MAPLALAPPGARVALLDTLIGRMATPSNSDVDDEDDGNATSALFGAEVRAQVSLPGRVNSFTCALTRRVYGAAAVQSDEQDDGGLLLDTCLSYDSFRLEPDDGRVVFTFSYRDTRSQVQLDTFTTSLSLPFPPDSSSQLPAGVHEAAFGVGMLSLSWLWVGLPTKNIVVRAKQMMEPDCTFWQETLNGCLAEFFQVHGMPPDSIIVSSSQDGGEQASFTAPAEHVESHQRRLLVPMGGGKDSTLVWTLLPPDVEKCWLYLADEPGEFEANWRLRSLAHVTTHKTVKCLDVLVATHNWRCPRWEAIRMRRFHSCGHPWAALVCFVSALAASLYGFDAIVMGNERSASEGNGLYRGRPVNHQHDKSLAWELTAAAYLRRHVSPTLEYFSALAHLWEIQIAELFWLRCGPELLGLITCCNVQHHGMTTRPCNVCAKCVFLALLFTAVCPSPCAAFAHFGDDILQSPANASVLDDLLGRDGAQKPMDCVGTADETAVCVHMARRSYMRAGLPLPRLLDGPLAELDAARGAEMEHKIRHGRGPHAVPTWAHALFMCDPPSEECVHLDTHAIY